MCLQSQDPNLTLNYFSTSDSARELYKAATHEKVALLRFWQKEAQDAAHASDVERRDRQIWLQDLSLLRNQMQDELQVSRKLISLHGLSCNAQHTN